MVTLAAKNWRKRAIRNGIGEGMATCEMWATASIEEPSTQFTLQSRDRPHLLGRWLRGLAKGHVAAAPTAAPPREKRLNSVRLWRHQLGSSPCPERGGAMTSAPFGPKGEELNREGEGLNSIPIVTSTRIVHVPSFPILLRWFQCYLLHRRMVFKQQFVYPSFLFY